MKVLTYNIAGNRGRHRAAHLEAVAELIRRIRPDVVGLQEVIHPDDERVPPEDVLARLTGMHAWYVPAHRHRRHTVGNALLCCRPLHHTVEHELPHPFPERRVLLEAETVTADGLPITVFCTHLVHLSRAAARWRLAQATAVAKRMATCWRPHFLLGDLNTGPRARELRPVRQLSRHDHLDGLRSWPAHRPLVLFDHIWPGPGWAIERIEVLDLRLSDHRPVFAQLGWKGAPRYAVMPDEPYLDPSLRRLGDAMR